MLEVKNLKVQFRTPKTSTFVVDGVSFKVTRGKVFGLIGESGSGKSLTSLSVLRLIPPSAEIVGGQIFYQGKDLLTLNDNQMRAIRGKEIAMVFQEPMSSLNPTFTVGQQIESTIQLHFPGLSLNQVHEKALKILSQVRISTPQEVFQKYPFELSGGQRQRVAIALALCCEPQLLIADEPTTALDASIQSQILELLKILVQEMNLGMILITHDLSIVAEMCDEIAIMQAGKIVETGSKNSIFNNPQHSYTKHLLNSIPRLRTDTQTSGQTSVLMAVKNLSKSYDLSVSEALAVQNTSLQVHQGEILGIVGESGSGKSTLGKCLARLLEPTSGEIDYQGQNITNLQGPALRALRKQIQYVFQDSYSALNPRMRILDILEEPLIVHQLASSKSERLSQIKKILNHVGLQEDMLQRYPHEFSGGQRQRLGLARALTVQPKLLICDEPLSGLDVSIQSQILALFEDLKNKLGLTIVLIGHDLRAIQKISDRVAVMNRGQIVEINETQKIFNEPQHSYTKMLLDSVLKLDLN